MRWMMRSRQIATILLMLTIGGCTETTGEASPPTGAAAAALVTGQTVSGRIGATPTLQTGQAPPPSAFPVLDVPPCDQAYIEVEQMVERAHAYPAHAEATVPDRDRFMASCASLSEQLQHCAILGYALDHEVTCAQASHALDAETQARINVEMGFDELPIIVEPGTDL